MTSTNITLRTSLRSRQGNGDRPITSPRGAMMPTGTTFGDTRFGNDGYGSGLAGSNGLLQNNYATAGSVFFHPLVSKSRLLLWGHETRYQHHTARDL